ncbi:MAG TPA: sulfatase-like hydrolase/transferase [Ottowia sp.]|uniref:phosphoethanolamine transferase n=1 Tax=Ottowia sp. TaxID=1898956 RepID=UPI002B65C8CD|nr:sulfatase-like hydrolase/transferase [Ottowia sp.]HMN21689.1 sulfatase-like hydrolase/transferase [Ottowia sp.]
MSELASSPVLSSARRTWLPAGAAAAWDWLGRPRTTRFVVCVLALYLLLATNWPLWAALARIGRAPSLYLPLVLGMGWLLLAGTVALLALTAWSRWMKPLWMALVLLAALVQYYMASYRTIMDPSMVANVLHTDSVEVRELLSGRMLLAVLGVAAPALAWLWRVPIVRERAWSRLWRNAVLLLLAAGAAAACVATMSRTLAPLMRNHTELRYMMNPLASLWSAGVVALRPALARGAVLEPISAGAALGPSYALQARPPLLVLVVGETARADHFGLNGYARDTTPELAARGAISWRQVQSCGTSTLASLPCMFSPWGRVEFERRRTPSENLLDVLQAAGLAVLWLDNQSGGCKGVCDRVAHAQVNDARAHPGLCRGSECLDDVLLQGLDEQLAALPPERVARGVVLVLHQMGSHGPAYFKRSPEAAKRFLPECRTNTLSDCSHSELINAYDNSIAYTDHILGRTIDWLRAQSGRFDTGLLYVGDHGESLGEYGLYLHGMPFRLAPDVQKHVPLVAWLDGGLGRRAGLADACLRAGIDTPLTHDNLYPTVLGLLDVRSPTDRPALDAWAGCRRPIAG